MGFKPSPVLPDFKRLQSTLTNSGVQKWNPAVNEILQKLIDANHQSQDVLTNTVITDAVNELTTSIDALTAAIAALNASAGASLYVATFSLTSAQIKALSGTPIDVISAPGATYMIVPVAFVGHSKHSVAYSTAQSVTLKYSKTAGGGGGASASFACDTLSNVTSTTASYESIQDCGIAFNTFDFASGASTGSPINKSLYAVGSVVPTGGNAGDTFNFALYYFKVISPA